MSTHQFEVTPGIHTITASATGYVTQQKTVDVQHDMTVNMTLQRVAMPSVMPDIGPIVGLGIAAAGILLLVLFLTRSDA